MKEFENKNKVKWFTSDEKGVRTLHCIYNTEKLMYYLIAKKYWINEKNKFHREQVDFDRINKPIEEVTADDIIKNKSTIIFQRNLVTEEEKPMYNVQKQGKSVTINGITYSTIKEAVEATGMSGYYIRKQMKKEAELKLTEIIDTKVIQDINVNDVHITDEGILSIEKRITEYETKINILKQALNILTGENK